MSHIKYITGEKEIERWSIDKENMRRCLINKCPHLSWWTCLKPRCVLIRNKDKFKLIKFV